MNCKQDFIIPKQQIYLCGHSLGPASHVAMASIQQGIQGWSDDLVQGWNTQQWLQLSTHLGQKIAPLLGAEMDEVIVADSTSINLLKCLLSALALNPSRKIILTENENFPTDRYIAESLTAMDAAVQLKSVSTEQLYDALDETIAVLTLTHVNYRSSQKHDMALVTRKAHSLGIIVVWDLSHSVGAMSLACNACGVDFAVGCTYKYLNGGPGSPGFIYVARRHHESVVPMIRGWMGHQTPFAFSPDYLPANGIKAYLTGTPPILSLSGLSGALDIFQGVDMARLQQISLNLTQQLIVGIDSLIPELTLVSSRNPLERGSHVAYAHQDAAEITQALITRGIIVDFRAPKLMRFGIAPLYIDNHDIEKVIQALLEIFRLKH